MRRVAPRATGALLALAACGAPTPRNVAPAPAPQAAATAVACDSAALRAPRDSVLVTARAELHGPADSTTLPEPYAELFLQAVGEQLVLPSPLALPVFAIRKPDVTGDAPGAVLGTAPIDVSIANGRAVAAAYLEYRLHLRDDGRIAEAALVTSSLSPTLDAAVHRAILRADSVGALPPVLREDRKPPAYLWLGVGIGLDSARYSVPWFRVRTPALPAASAPFFLPGNSPPTYPRELQERGVPGEVRVRVVIDEAGRPVPGSVALRRLSHPAFGKAVLDVLPSYRVEPARIAGCPVKALAQLPFLFEVAGPGGIIILREPFDARRH